MGGGHSAGTACLSKLHLKNALRTSELPVYLTLKMDYYA